MRIPLSTCLQSCLLAFASLASAQNPVYLHHAKPEHVQVMVLTVAASIRHGSGNQQIYLAEVTRGSGSPELAKLVDTYSGDGSPILSSLLAERHLFQMTLLRNPECDAAAESFFIGGAGAKIFDPETSTALRAHAADALPCFTVDHEATRLAK